MYSQEKNFNILIDVLTRKEQSSIRKLVFQENSILVEAYFVSNSSFFGESRKLWHKVVDVGRN